jgi:hypothetical protein
MRRLLMIFAALLIPVGGMTLALSSTDAFAGGKIVCTTMTGTLGTTLTVSGCTGNDGIVSSNPISPLLLAAGGSITWSNGGTTTIAAPAVTQVSSKKCPGYITPVRGQPVPTEPSAVSFVSPVVSDTGDGMLLPSTSTGEVCLSTDADPVITLLKKMAFEWTSSSISCTAVNGSVVSNAIVVSGCTGGDTGGGSATLPALALATGGTIQWTSGSSTTIGAPTLTKSVGKLCPGYITPVHGQPAPTEPTLEKFTAVVTSDSGDGLKLPGASKGSVCIGTDVDATITAAGPLLSK